jgi:excisionase family DNA binding protein
MPEKLMTIKDVAKFLQYSEVQTRRLITKGEIPYIRIGGGRGIIRVVPEQLQEYIKRKSEVNDEKHNS